MEIGSEFWLESEKIIYSKDTGWLEKYGNYQLTSSGRGAIYLLLEEINPKKRKILLPSYICDSVISPFVHHGYQCAFYELNEDLSPSINSIMSHDDIGVFLHMGYFGFPTNDNLKNIILNLKNRNTIIIEDVTHTLFSETQTLLDNDYYIASIRKWMGLPSGGFFASKHELNSLKHKVLLPNNFAEIRKKALLLKYQYLLTGDLGIKQEYETLFRLGENMLIHEECPSNIDAFSKNILDRLDISLLSENRKNNFIYLMEHLKEFQKITPVFATLPDTVCPLFYPIYIENRNDIKNLLIKFQIFCPVHWNVPEVLEITEFRSVQNIYQKILSIPCDQRYGKEHMKRIITVFRELYTIF